MRGPMRLHLADIHLHRAHLFFREKSYPWKSPQDDLAAAGKLGRDWIGFDVTQLAAAQHRK